VNAPRGIERDERTRAGEGFAERYRHAFLAYVASGAEADLTPAYDLSREAVGGHLSLLTLAEAHRAALAEGVLSEHEPVRQRQAAERAADFLRESLATFEIAHRSYLEVKEVARIEHEHARQLQSIAEVSVALNASLPVADILELVTAEARQLLGARYARARLDPRSAAGMSAIPALDATSGEAPPTSAEEAVRLRAGLYGRHGLAIGELEVFAPEEPDAGDEAILVQLAHVASAAIRNAQLYGAEREIAETLQRSLLPRRLPRIEGLDLEARYCAAGDGNVVGGDFYDVFRTRRGDAWGIAIGDVCGKGPEAAALTALVRYTLRAAALWEQRPERVMELLNSAILEQRSDYRFCTALYGHLVHEDGGARAELVNCGHPLPLVVRSGGAVESVGSHGTLLGVVPDPDLHLDTVTLAPGDLLLLFTDGVTEVRRGGREVFGLAQLHALVAELGGISAAKAAERIEDAVLNACGGPPRDDLAVIAIRLPA
jgi:serine phosphatase RsbU (regulator of sigma subunit)